MKRMRVPLFVLGLLLPAAIPLRAQTDEVTPGNFNSTFIAPATAPVGSNQAADNRVSPTVRMNTGTARMPNPGTPVLATPTLNAQKAPSSHL